MGGIYNRRSVPSNKSSCGNVVIKNAIIVTKDLHHLFHLELIHIQYLIVEKVFGGEINIA